MYMLIIEQICRELNYQKKGLVEKVMVNDRMIVRHFKCQERICNECKYINFIVKKQKYHQRI